MIIFTVKNTITSQVYVGTTRNTLKDQWNKMTIAANQGLDYPLYDEIRCYGINSFLVEEWDYSENRKELHQLEIEALSIHNARSLKGYKTSNAKLEFSKITKSKKGTSKKLIAIMEDLELPVNEYFPEEKSICQDDNESDSFFDITIADMKPSEINKIADKACLEEHSLERKTIIPQHTDLSKSQNDLHCTKTLQSFQSKIHETDKEKENLDRDRLKLVNSSGVTADGINDQLLERIKSAVKKNRKTRLQFTKESRSKQRQHLVLLLNNLELRSQQLLVIKNQLNVKLAN